MGKAQTAKVRIQRNIDGTEETTSTGWKTHDFLGHFITDPETEEKLEDLKKKWSDQLSVSESAFSALWT